MSMAGALRNHQQNWNRMQDNTYSGIEQRADESAMQNQTELRSQNLAMDKAKMDDATTLRGQNLGLMGDLSKPSMPGLGGLNSLLDGLGSSGARSGMQSSLSPGLIAMGNTGIATVGARQGEWDTPQFKTGGLIDGPPPPPDGSDNVDIKAKAGEYVLPPEAVELLGLETLDRIVMAATGQPPVHGGVPTDEGTPGFAMGGGIEDLAAEQRLAMKAASNAKPNDRPAYMSAETKLPPSAPSAATSRSYENGSPGAWSVASPDTGKPFLRLAGEGLARGAVATSRGLSDMGTAMYHGATSAGRAMVDNPFTRGFTGKPEPEPKTPLAPQARPQTAPSAPTSGPAHPAARRVAEMMATETNGPGDNVQATGITGKDSAGNVQQVYKNEFQPGSKEYAEYGRAIYSDSKRGATQRGFDADFAKSGNYVGDPATGKGMPLPPTAGKGARLGLGELSPQETQAVLMGYGPARQAGLQDLVNRSNLETMRQWKGKDLANALDQVKELFGQPLGLEANLDRYLSRALSPEGQAEQAQQQAMVAAAKAAGRGRTGQQKTPAELQAQWIDSYLPAPTADDPKVTAQRGWMALTADKISGQHQIPPQRLYPALASVATLEPAEDETPEVFEMRKMMELQRLLGQDYGLVPQASKR